MQMGMLQLRYKFCLFPRTKGYPEMLKLHCPNQKAPRQSRTVGASSSMRTVFAVCFIADCISFTVAVAGTWRDFISITGMKPGRGVDVWSLRCPKEQLGEGCLGPGVWGQPGQKRKTESLIVKITIKAGCGSSCLQSQKIEAGGSL